MLTILVVPISMTRTMELKKKTKTHERYWSGLLNRMKYPANLKYQDANEKLLQKFVEDCDGAYGTLEQAVTELEIPRIKITKSVASFKGFLQLGDASKYETALRIPVERYFRTYSAKPPSASSFALRSGGDDAQDERSAQSQAPGEGNTLTAVRTSRTYQINDESAPGGKVDVEREDLAKGYEYGRTAVHISPTEENITNLETFAGLEIMGFINNDKVHEYDENRVVRADNPSIF